ncbi:MAG: type VII toxin-antitoxin system MntA family adenylyltransferase antitoxin [Gammaproteobacteria bacterium]
MNSVTQTAIDDAALLAAIDEGFSGAPVVILFGSVARGTARADSDIDIAVDAGRPLTVDERVATVEALALLTGRPVDLVDLHTAGEPLLGQILRHGRRLRASDMQWGDLYARHIYECTDFLPYRNRILEERRAAWIGK